MNVLSLFDGISGARVALDRAGIPVTSYHAYEIDKHAIKVSKKNYPNIIHMGDINDWVLHHDLPKFDLLVGGFPCQAFSFAGKQLNFDDPRGKLFFHCVHILKALKPKYFLFENVRMKKQYMDTISDLIGVQPIEINSALVSAQNRRRNYWSNILGIKQPEDKGILLKDILEENIDEKYYMSEGWQKWLAENKEFQLSKKYSAINPDKCITMTARQYSSYNGKFVCDKRKPVGFTVSETGLRPFKNDGKLGSISEVGTIAFKDTKKTQCLTSTHQPKIINDKNPLNCEKLGFIKTDSQGNRVYSVEKKSTTLSALGGGCGAKTGLYETEGRIRKLTPIECERLQTYPDNYTDCISDSQRYKALGNSFTVDVIAHILKGIK